MGYVATARVEFKEIGEHSHRRAVRFVLAPSTIDKAYTHTQAIQESHTHTHTPSPLTSPHTPTHRHVRLLRINLSAISQLSSSPQSGMTISCNYLCTQSRFLEIEKNLKVSFKILFP